MLAKADLLARLAEGHAARITVVTPNRRLASTLTAELDAYQAGRNLSVWEAADILPFDAWVERLWEDALYSDTGQMSGGSLPLLLTPAQEQAIWEEILASAELLSVAQAWRKTAVFSGLMTFLSRHYLALGCDLAVISGTLRQLKLYRHLGFEPFAEPVGTVEATYQPMYLTLAAFIHRSAFRQGAASFT
jgi:hypothetical protein